MFYKIARNNVKKEFRNYAAYFLTLIGAVCLYYLLNAIEDLGSVLHGGNGWQIFLYNMKLIMPGLSVLVSLVLAGLVLYTNRFLMDRRGREFAIYMTMGISRRQIFSILFRETLLVGAIALSTGLAIGFVISQAMVLFTAHLLDVEIAQFRLFFSVGAAIKTLLSYTVVFTIVMIHNRIRLTRCQLTELLYPNRQKQRICHRHPRLLAILLLLSLILLIGAYFLLRSVVLRPHYPLLLAGIAGGVAGTFLFVYSASGCLAAIVSRCKQFYFQGLNAFVFQQLKHTISRHFVAVAASGMLLSLSFFISVGALFYGANVGKTMENSLNFDASAILVAASGVNDEEDLRNRINQNHAGIRMDDETQMAICTSYQVDTSLCEILGDALSKRQRAQIQASDNAVYGISNIAGNAAALTNADYNQVRKLLGHAPIYLSDDEVLVVSNYDDGGVLSEHLQQVRSIELSAHTYKIRNRTPIVENVITQSSVYYFYLVVPDTFTDFLAGPDKQWVNFQYTGNQAQQSIQSENIEALFDYYAALNYNRPTDREPVILYGLTSDQYQKTIYSASAGMVFVSLYLGLLFLLVSVVVLAIQQLSAACESADAFRILQKTGVPSDTLRKAILQQTLVYFGFPLAIALTYTAIGLQLLHHTLNPFHLNILSPVSVLVLLLFTFVFLEYLYITVRGCQIFTALDETA